MQVGQTLFEVAKFSLGCEFVFHTSHYLSIGYITRGRSLRDLHTRGPQARGNVNHRRDRLPSDVTNLYHGKSIEHLTRFEDRNNVWPKLMVSYKFMLK